MRPHSPILALVALAATVGGCSTEGGPPLFPETPREWTTTRFVTVAEGAELTASGITLTIPPGAMLWDDEVGMTVAIGYASAWRFMRQVRTTALFTRGPLTVTARRWPGERRPPVVYAATADGDAYPVTLTDDVLTVELDSFMRLTIVRGEPECNYESCPDGTTCHADGCLATCAGDADCPDETWCDLVLGGISTWRRRCDPDAHVCVAAGREFVRCERACDLETVSCVGPGACPPPERPWPGPTGICVCPDGHRNVRCEGAAEDGSPAPWVGAACDFWGDCEGLGCEAADCLLPGHMYPTGCLEEGVMLLPDCQYDPNALGACAVMCVEG